MERSLRVENREVQQDLKQDLALLRLPALDRAKLFSTLPQFGTPQPISAHTDFTNQGVFINSPLKG